MAVTTAPRPAQARSGAPANRDSIGTGAVVVQQHPSDRDDGQQPAGHAQTRRQQASHRHQLGTETIDQGLMGWRVRHDLRALRGSVRAMPSARDAD